MTVPRDNLYMYATWPTRYITGDKSCLWACWYKTHYYRYQKAPSDFDLVRWQAEHTILVESLTNELEQKGCTVWIEHQNSFKIESPRSGLTVSGRPDLIARHPDGTAVIYDAKTGRQSTSHILQVQIYMYLLPRTPGSPWRGTRFSGAVVYADGTEHHIPPESIDGPFVARLAKFMQKMASETHAACPVSSSAASATSQAPTAPSRSSRTSPAPQTQPRDTISVAHKPGRVAARNHQNPAATRPSRRAATTPTPAQNRHVIRHTLYAPA